MGLKYLAVVLGLAVSYVAGQAFQYPANCAAPNKTQLGTGVPGPIPPLPKLPATFQTKVEANIIDKGKTISAEEFYDDPNNRVVVRTIQNNTQDYLLLDYYSNQIVYVVNNNCTVKDLLFDANQLLFGLTDGPSGMPHVYTTSGALHFAISNGLTYLGKTAVRGISVDHWQSCMYWDILLSNFTLDYYFTSQDWNDPVLYPQIPVRAEVQGLQTATGSYQFHHIYDYFDFRTKIWADQSVFQVPAGFACKGLIPKNFTYPSNCAAKNTTQSISGPAPPVPTLPQTFQTRVEANIIDKQKTIVAKEYYNGAKNLAAVHTIQNNTEDYMILDYKNNQILEVVNGICTVKDLEFDANQELFGLKSAAGVPHVLSTTGALHFAINNGLTYMGRTTVRGINVDHWQSCMFWDILFSNFTLDYYFTVASWTDSILHPQIPVRAEVSGSQVIRTFHHIYDYFDFRDYVWEDDSAFETPAGTVCPGRKQTKPVPQLAGKYSYREEIVSIGSQMVSQADIWYDLDYKLVRFDYRPAYPSSPYYTTNPVTEIHDYNSGVAYAMDRKLGNCSIIPIQNASFDSSINISVSTNNNQKQFVVRMKSPSQLFYLDNTSYTYEGQRTVRDMTCDVFVSNRNDFNMPGYATGSFNSTFVFYFLANSWTASNNAGRVNAMNTQIPIRLDITTDSWVGYKASYNIYNFVQEDPVINTFDVTRCYDAFSQQPFVIQFPGSYDSSLFSLKSSLLKATVDTLMRVTHLPRIRIQKEAFHIEPSNAYFVGALMDVPPPISFYQKVSGAYQRYSNDKTETLPDANSCAAACNNGDVNPCNSFEYCAATNLCSLSMKHANDGTVMQGQGNCDYYARTVRSQPFELALGQAWKNLKNVVISGDFKINVNVNGNPVQYTASSVAQNAVQNGQRQLSTQAALQNFNVQINKAIPGYDDLILSGQAIDDCAASCQNQEEWVCNSFEYCIETGYCVLSKLHPDERPGIVVNKQLCDLYSRKYTANYEMIQGTTVLSSSDAIYQNIYSADECGKLCSNYQGFNCKSFDYCDYLSTCYLGRSHYYDIPKANRQLTPSCNHYSRNYVNDFKQTARKSIANRDDRIIVGISVTQCAKLCVQEESFNCASFGYCGNTTECRLSTASMKNIGQISVTANLFCDIYNRETFPDGTPYIVNPQNYFPNSQAPTGPSATGKQVGSSGGGGGGSGGYSGGAMAGIGFGMLIVGLVLAVVIFVVVSKVRGKPLDNMTVSFVKQQEADS